jgi:hypothetical protein
MREVTAGHYVACHFPLQEVADPTPTAVSAPEPTGDPVPSTDPGTD